MPKYFSPVTVLLVTLLAIIGGAGSAAAQDRVKAYIGSTKEPSCAFLTIQGTTHRGCSSR